MKQRILSNPAAFALIGVVFAFSMSSIAFADTASGSITAPPIAEPQSGLGGVIDRLKALRDQGSADKGTLSALMNRPKPATSTTTPASPAGRPCVNGNASSTRPTPMMGTSTRDHEDALGGSAQRDNMGEPCNMMDTSNDGMRMSTTTRLKLTAEASSTVMRIQKYIDDLKKASDMSHQKAQDRMTEIKKHVNAAAYQAIQSIMRRLTETYGQLSLLLNNAASALMVAAGTGADVSVADAKVKLAQADLLDAQSAIDAAQAKIAITVAASSTSQASLTDIHTAVETAVSKLKTAYAAAVEAFTATKAVTGISVRINGDASSTASH
jgi:polyhydroxyalkanoate synthesis regulator phasin